VILIFIKKKEFEINELKEIITPIMLLSFEWNIKSIDFVREVGVLQKNINIY